MSHAAPANGEAAMAAPIRSTLDANGVLLATIDMPGRTMNVFSVELMDALDALMDRADSDPHADATLPADTLALIDAAALAALAGKLSSLPWRTPGPASVLQGSGA